MYASQEQEEVQYDLDKPVDKNVEKSPNYSILEQSQTRSKRRIAVPSNSHAIALFNTLPAICIEKVVYMKTGEDLSCKVHQSPRLPHVVLTPNSQDGRQDLSNPEARTSSDHQGERSAKYEELVAPHIHEYENYSGKVA